MCGGILGEQVLNSEQEARGSIPGLAVTISEIGYPLLQVAIWLKYRWKTT